MNRKYVIGNLGKVKTKFNFHINNELKNYNLKGMCTSHGSILTVLRIHERLTMKQISKMIGKDKSTVTALINKLMKMDYVKKNRCEIDNRVSYITLTKKGSSVEEIFSDISSTIAEQSFKGFSQEEIEILSSLLSKIEDNIS